MRPKGIRVATYNVRKARGTDGRRDPQRILDIVRGLDADVVALQEADFRLPPRRPVFAADGVEAATGLVPVEFEHGRESLGWHGNALLFRRRYTLHACAHHDLPGLEPRGAVEALMEIDGMEVRVVSAHLGLLRRSRRQQLSAIKEILANRPPAPTIVMGDFNELSLRKGLGRLSPYRIFSAGPTFPARRPIFALDRIAISDPLHMDGMTVWRTPETAVASDHLPLIGEVTLGDGG